MNRKLFYLILIVLLFFFSNSHAQCTMTDPVLTTSVNKLCSELILQHDPGEPPIILPGTCWQVCRNSSVSYQVPFHAGSTYQWLVTAVPSSAIQSHIPSANQCVVNYGTLGNVIVTVIESNGTCSTTVSQCVNVLDIPVADFIAPNVQYDPIQNEYYIEVCQWANLNFLNNSFDPASSSANILSHWDFGDGTSSTETSPSHIFTGSGPFIVELTVTNACGCTDSKKVTIRMMEGIATEIYCADPVCANASASYTVNASGCSSYNWNVVNGTILSPANNNYVQVTWNNGANGPGILSFTGIGCAGTCPTTASITVPILSTSFPISGPVLVCPEPQTVYSVPNVPGSTYLWTLSGPGGAYIAGDDCDNEVTIDWTFASPGSKYTLTVNYSNPILPCGTLSTCTLDIDVGTPFTVTGPSQLCNGQNATFNIIAAAYPGTPTFTWQIKVVHPDGTISAYQHTQIAGTSLVLTPWTYGAGTVYITAIDNNNFYCEADHKETYIMKVDGAVPPAVPTGDLFVCPGTSHLYSSNALPGNYLNWSITGSTSPTPLTGNSVSINWGTPPYSISLTQVDMTSGCASDPSVLNVTPITSVAPVVSGDLNPCTNSKRTYTISNSSSLHFDQIHISVEPPSAGSLIGPSGTVFQIQWNHYQYATANIRIDITSCGNKTTYTTAVSLNGQPSVNINLNTPTPLCEGVPVSFTATGGYPGGTYSWDYGDGLFVAGAGATVNHPYDLPNGTTAGVPFNVIVTATSPDGTCMSTGTLPITIYPNPTVTIASSPSCLPTNGSALLTANISGGPGGTYNYSWSTGGTTQSISVNTSGTYTVSISNSFNSCAATDIYQLDPCNCTDDPDVTLNLTYSHNATECRTIQFNGGYTNNGTNVLSTSPQPFNWDFGDGGSSNSQNPIYTFITGGPHLICFTVYLRDAFNNLYCKKACISIELPDFTWQIVCPAVPGQNYNVRFTGTDPFANGSPTYTWWNGASTMGNGLTFTTSLPQGNYPIKFETSSGQHCTITKSFIMPLALDATFTASAGPYCEDQTRVLFTAVAGNHYHSYFWDYGESDPGPPQVLAQYLSFNNHTGSGYNTSNHVFASPSSSRIVTLTITDVFGCTNSSTNSYAINLMNLDGIVDPANSSVCLGNSVTLQYMLTPGTLVPSSYVWSTGATTATINAQQTGQYNVTVFHNTSGCQFAPWSPANVHVHTVPQPDIRGKKDICYGDPAILNGNAGLGVNYSWNIGSLTLAAGSTLTSPSITTTNITPSVLPVSYPVSLTITDPTTSCSLSTNVNIAMHNFAAIPAIVSNPIPACPGTVFNLEVTNNTGTPPHFVHWSNGGFGNITSTSYAGVYRATFTDVYGCNLGYSDYFIPKAPDLSFMLTGCYEMCIYDQFTVPGSSCEYVDQWEWVMITQTPGVFYTVSGGGFIQDFVINNTNFPNMIPGVYEIILNVNHNGCEYMNVFKMTVSECGKCGIETPPNAPFGISCLFVNGRTAVFSFSYDFIIGTGVNTPFTADLDILSPNPGLSITSSVNSSGPNVITMIGTISCDLTVISLPTSVQYRFTYSYNDPVSGQYILCTADFDLDLPDCATIPGFCESGDFVNPTMHCTGYDIFGNRQYSFAFDLPAMFGTGTNYVVYSYSPDLTLNTSPATVNSTGTYFCSVTDEQPFLSPGQPACIFMYFIDYTDPQNPVTCYIDECFVLPECEDPCESVPCGDRIANPYSEQEQLHIYPNPAGENAFVTWQVAEGQWKLRISDLKGQQISHIPISQANASITLDLSQYAPGVYLVSLINQHSVLEVKKLVIIR